MHLESKQPYRNTPPLTPLLFTKANVRPSKSIDISTFILLPDPAAMAGKDDVEADVEASDGGSRVGVPKGSEGAERLAEGGCWMVWREWPPSMEGRLGCPSKSYSSLTISPVLVPELVSVSPDRSEDKNLM